MGKILSVEIITMTFNERFLLPFFLKHYSFANIVRVIDDEESTEDISDIISEYPNAIMEKIRFPSGFDNDLAVAKLNECYRTSPCDWVIAVDADEFVIEPNLLSILSDTEDDIFYVRLYQVYRNHDDKDLDLALPIMEQRRHGDPGAVQGRNRKGAKPIIVRGGLNGMKWQPGQHNIWNRHKWKTSEQVLLGSHWMMADPCFSVARRMRGVMRQSEANRVRGNSSHYNTLTEQQVWDDINAHTHNQRLF